MPPFPLTGWLNDRILGKRGRKYKIIDIENILTHYNIRPTQCTPRKPYLLQQLSLLVHTHHLTRADRWRITKSPRALDIRAAQASKTSTPTKSLRSIIPLRVQCQACLEDLISRKFPKRRITIQCDHEPLICRSCLQLSIDIQISGHKQWNLLKCPLCPQKLTFETVKKYASSETFEQYDYRAAIHVLCSLPDFRLCTSPDCGSGQFHEMAGDDLPIWTCQKCERRMCFRHEVEWHEGIGCGEYEETVGKRRLEEIRLSLKFLEETTKICPGEGCGLHIEKLDGCDHMTCHKCAHQFCWRCLNPYDSILIEGNEGHKESCPYSSDLLPSNALLDPEGYLDEEGNVRILADTDEEVDMVEEWNGIQDDDEEHDQEQESVLVREEDQEGVAAALAQQVLQTQREEDIRNEQERQHAERRERRRTARTQRRRKRRREARMRRDGRD